MSISNSAYQNELEKLPISTGIPVTPYFYALIIKADLIFVLWLFVQMNWMRNFNWNSDKSQIAKEKSN